MIENDDEVAKKYYEIYDKILKVSNSEFPLIDFLNDIILIKDKNFNKKQALIDIEKIYNTFMYYIK